MAYCYSFWGKLEPHGEEQLLYLGFTEAVSLDSRMRGNYLHKQGFEGNAVIRYVEMSEVDMAMLEIYLISTEAPFFNRKGNWKQIPTLFSPNFDSVDWQVWRKGKIKNGKYCSALTAAEWEELKAEE